MNGTSRTRGETELAGPAMTCITGPLVLPGCSSEDVEAFRLISVAWLWMSTMLTSPKPLTTPASAVPRGLGRLVRPTPRTRGERFIGLTGRQRPEHDGRGGAACLAGGALPGAAVPLCGRGPRKRSKPSRCFVSTSSVFRSGLT